MLRILGLGFILLVFFFAGCASNRINKKVTILDYADFGPQAMAYEILGKQWWQWEAQGVSRTTDYDIKVVVYRDISLKKIKKKFQVDEDELQDYRYVEYEVAVGFLDRHIEENIFRVITDRLETTRKELTGTNSD